MKKFFLLLFLALVGLSTEIKLKTQYTPPEPEIMTHINDSKDALRHWLSRAGGVVKAGKDLLKEIKEQVRDSNNIDERVDNHIKYDIKDARKNKKDNIKRTHKPKKFNCLTLGNAVMTTIEYDYNFKKNRNEKVHIIDVHYKGEHVWDLDSYCKGIKNHYTNYMCEDDGAINRDAGKPFTITFEFYFQYKYNENTDAITTVGIDWKKTEKFL